MDIKVTLPYDPLWTPLDWAKKYCASYITNDVHGDESNTYVVTTIDYFFSDEQDAIWFRLRWE